MSSVADLLCSHPQTLCALFSWLTVTSLTHLFSCFVMTACSHFVIKINIWLLSSDNHHLFFNNCYTNSVYFILALFIHYILLLICTYIIQSFQKQGFPEKCYINWMFNVMCNLWTVTWMFQWKVLWKSVQMQSLLDRI